MITRLALAFRPESQITQRPYQDDAFYALDCGKHLAHGDGFSVDGVHPTNGVQPLIVILYSVCFLLGGSDAWLGVRLTFALVAIIDALCVVLVYRTIRTFQREDKKYALDPAMCGAFLWTFVLSNLIHNAIGLETGLYAMTILLSLYVYGAILRDERAKKNIPLWRRVLLGAVLGVVVLSRIDGVFVAIAIAAVDFFTRKEDNLIRRLLPTVAMSVVALLVSSPWWIYNYTTFGSFMPISGQSESIGAFIAANLHFSATVIANILFVSFYVPTDYPPGDLTMGIALLLVAAAVICAIKLRVASRLRTMYELRPLGALAAAAACLVIFYTFFFSAPHFIGRYFHPLRVGVLLLAALLLPLWYENWKRRTWRSPVKYVLAAYMLVSVAFNTMHYIYNFTMTQTSALYWAGVWVQHHPQWKVGMTSSGTAGFMSDRVENLDGKVNYEALQARRQNALGAYVIRSGVEVLTSMDLALLAETERSGAAFAAIDTFRGTTYYLRKQ